MKKPTVINHVLNASAISWHLSHVENNFTLTVVPTVAGFVMVTTWLDPKHQQNDSTSLRFIYGGQLHERSIRGQRYSERYCVTLARRFVQEITNGGAPNESLG